jgi:hypothetical protein
MRWRNFRRAGDTVGSGGSGFDVAGMEFLWTVLENTSREKWRRAVGEGGELMRVIDD